jgi:hypothetical protein
MLNRGQNLKLVNASLFYLHPYFCGLGWYKVWMESGINQSFMPSVVTAKKWLGINSYAFTHVMHLLNTGLYTHITNTLTGTAYHFYTQSTPPVTVTTI